MYPVLRASGSLDHVHQPFQPAEILILLKNTHLDNVIKITMSESAPVLECVLLSIMFPPGLAGLSCASNRAGTANIGISLIRCFGSGPRDPAGRGGVDCCPYW